MENTIHESGCSDGWSTPISDINGECPDCGHPTIDGDAASGCFYSPVECQTCGHAPCNGFC